MGKNESSNFWLGVLTDLKARGVEDILVTATDNLNGFTQTIKNVFPESPDSNLCSASNTQLNALCSVER